MSIAENLTINTLEKCKNYKKAILNLNRDIEIIEEEIYNLRSINFEAIKIRDKENYRLEEKIQEKKDLETLLKTNITRLNNIENTIRQLRDLETINIIIEFYINDNSNIADLEEKLKLSRSTIYRKKEKGIKNLALIMYGYID